MTRIKKILTFLLLLFYLAAPGQELPPIQRYTPSDYHGDNQNWMMSQSSDKFLYVANNRGLLEYNGSKWTLYPSPNNSVMRAVKVVGDRIYTGCHTEFGFWVRGEYGMLNYQSLIPKIEDYSFEDDQVWNIIQYDDWILFQSGHDLFFYHSESEKFRIISSDNIIYKVFKVGSKIYYHVANEGIYIIDDGEPRLVIDHPIILNDRVINIYEMDGSLLFNTRNSGFYVLNNEELEAWNISTNSLLKDLNIFTSIQLKNGDFILGTISNGLLSLSSSGEINFNINHKKGLGNNTVLSLYEDVDRNVWVGLDNGITCVNMDSPIQNFIDYEGRLGTVYTIRSFQDKLYVGTNQGLFYRLLNSPDQEFKFVNGTAGQVWSLYNDNDENLLCGHHLGTFLIEEETATKISSQLGAWEFKKVPSKNGLLLQGNYDGIYILEKIEGRWRLRNKLDGFNTSSRFLECNSENQIWVNHEYKGVFRLEVNSDLTKVLNVHLHNELPNRENSSLVSLNGDVLYHSNAGFYTYRSESENFERDTILNSLITEDDNITGRMVVDENERLWVFSDNNIKYTENNPISSELEIKEIAIPSDLRKGVLGFENIQLMGEDLYKLGTTTGYLSIDISEKPAKKEHYIYLNSISVKEVDENSTNLQLDEKSILKYKHGMISFSFSVPEYDKFHNVRYQYRLVGHNERWSTWDKMATVKFENLSYGPFDFQVRGKVGNRITENIASHQFTVKRPWYISNPALVFYLLVLTGIGFLVHRAYKFYYERILKHEQIKNEKAIMQIQNEKLNQEIESKNSELAISTMSIIRKNELLGKIKKDLTKNNVESTIKLIDNNLSNNSDWKLFKKAFNNADKDFLDRIKEKHPELTPNDLRFCAYLRLNLSSKEIAPLLNISTKSVETKRYRLRKRLGLNHEDGLADYIIKF